MILCSYIKTTNIFFFKKKKTGNCKE